MGGRELIADELDIDDIVKLQRATKIKFGKILSQELLERHPDDLVLQSFAKLMEDDPFEFLDEDEEEDYDEDWGLFDE